VIFRMSQVNPLYENSGGSVRIADSGNFPFRSDHYEEVSLANWLSPTQVSRQVTSSPT
jgi:hypothetical protein